MGIGSQDKIQLWSIALGVAVTGYYYCDRPAVLAQLEALTWSHETVWRPATLWSRAS